MLDTSYQVRATNVHWVCDTRFKLPLVGLALMFGPSFAREIETDQQAARAIGYEMEVFGWPDGTTVVWKWPANELLNEDELFEAYCACRARMASAMEAHRHDA